ncbi:hypothetical protein QTP88_008198 [Uroleucon formosanum]
MINYFYNPLFGFQILEAFTLKSNENVPVPKILSAVRSGSEEEQKPQWVICFEVLSNEALKPSKLKRHLETKHKEHVTKTIDFFKNREYELRKNMKCIKKSSTIYCNEIAVKASFAVIFKVEDKIEAMIKKLELWNLQVSKYIKQHIEDPQRSFRDYFPVPDINRNWIRHPFEIDITQINGLISLEEDNLIEIFTNGSLKLQFHQKSLEMFWFHVQKDYPVLSSKALKVLIPFPTTYLCEKAFSALVYVKNKFRNRLENVVSELRLKLSNIDPNIEKLMPEMEYHPSY